MRFAHFGVCESSGVKRFGRMPTTTASTATPSSSSGPHWSQIHMCTIEDIFIYIASPMVHDETSPFTLIFGSQRASQCCESKLRTRAPQQSIYRQKNDNKWRIAPHVASICLDALRTNKRTPAHWHEALNACGAWSRVQTPHKSVRRSISNRK
jgi:hypothetical protein